MKPRIGVSGYPRVVDTVLGPTLLHTATRYYVDAVVRAGGIPLVLPALGADAAADVLPVLDGLVLTGGGDVAPARYGATPAPETANVDPVRDEFDLELVCGALGEGVPVLAICRGMQVVNVALGGSLVQHVPAHQHVEQPDRPMHDVTIDPSSQLAAALGVTTLPVNSMHHQAVLDPAPGLVAVAWAPDGSVEAVEQRDGDDLVAVQWHPELMEDQPIQQGLFQRLVAAATDRSARAPRRPPRAGPSPA